MSSLSQKEGGGEMRLKLDFELYSNEFPIESRRVALSFFKAALEQYDQALFKNMFSKSKSIMKDYVFSLYLPIKKIEDEKIILKNPRIHIYFSTDDLSLGVNFYNAFNACLNKKLKNKGLSYMLKKINMIYEETIVNSEINVKFMSPLLVRDFLEKGDSELYIGPDDERFEKRLNEIVAVQIKELKSGLGLKGKISIEPINTKKTVIKHYGQFIDGYGGIYCLKSNPEILNYLYKSGVGSRRSHGFGMFNLI